MTPLKFAGWGHPGKEFTLADKPDLCKFITRVTGLEDFEAKPLVNPDSIAIPPPRLSEAFLADLQAVLAPEWIRTDREMRLLHCYGKSYRDLLRSFAGVATRPPDLVVFPGCHDEVETLLRIAAKHGVKVIPFGGGTNIVGGVEASPSLAGTIATVSLRRMRRVLSIDAVSLTARIEVGILGPELEESLNREGFTLGHFPDSFEHSTLGGWLATRSAGMQSDRWGRIEDMVLSLTLVTPRGTLRTPSVPKAATGPDLNQIAVGSEGVLGILTEATMRLHRLMGREHRGLLLPDFASGVALLRDCAQLGIPVSTMRLSCPEETHLGVAMKPRRKGTKALVQQIGKEWLRYTRNFHFETACALIVGFEGSPREIAMRRKEFSRIVKSCGGIDLGTSSGEHWYAGRYDYPYLRDALMVRGGMVDVVETSVVWSEVESLCRAMKETLHAHFLRSGHEGYVGCHLSHTYQAGACLYFTFASLREEGRATEQYFETKSLAIELLIRHGAALSHHHAVGYEHRPWIRRALGETAMALLRGLKEAVDPEDLCNPGKLLPPKEGDDDLFPLSFPDHDLSSFS